jgi:murein L,D-transpeptidase YcbB/YkuD
MRRLLPFSLLALLTTAAIAQTTTPAAPPAAVAPAAAPAPALGPLEEAVRTRVDQLRYASDLDVRGARIVLGDAVARYYEGQGFRGHWGEAARLDELIGSLGGLRDDGLDPADYHVDALQTFREELRGGRRLAPEQQADLELLATDALLLGLSHLYRGKVDPEKLSSQWNFGTRPVPEGDPLARVAELVRAGHIRDTFDRARPGHRWYTQGRESLKAYRAIEAAGGWPILPDGPVLKPGMEDARVPVLRERLRITGDLLATEVAASAAAVPLITAPAAPATTTAPGILYDPVLETAVKRFQERHGLAADGVIGPGTRAALNVPVGARIDQIRVNLERGRWVLHEIQGEFVLVDVAGFEVAYFKNDQPVWNSRVVVGRDSRETPIFKSKITYVVLNPTWTIPPGILVKDKLPILKRDPGYLKRTRIRVIDSRGREVDPYSVNWSRYSAGNLPPYQFVQDPGPDNALGLVKIMFPNPYLVYLHDSPAKSLFERDARTFSSGCIRVEKPFELAELVLGDPVRWNQASIKAAIEAGKTQTVNLARPVPVLILYWTAQPRPDGQVVFRNDVYSRDAATLRALDAPFGRAG